MATGQAGQGEMEEEQQRRPQPGPSPRALGSIHMIVGPMFAGKSTALLGHAREQAASGRRVAVLKPLIDDRFGRGLGVLSTHAGDAEPCFAVAQLDDFRRRHAAEYAACDVLAIDEAQFFPDLVEFCAAAAEGERSKDVYVAGLDGDFRRGPFGRVLQLVPLADTVVKLRSKCADCGAPGLFTARVVEDSRQQLVGAADLYRACCRAHYQCYDDARPPAKGGD